MMKLIAIAILAMNGSLLLLWTWRAYRFSGSYNSRMPEKAQTVYLATLLLGHQAAAHGVMWLLKDGYKDCAVQEIVREGNRLKRFTVATALFSLTIPMLAILWFHDAI
jgi:hypothetical protein